MLTSFELFGAVFLFIGVGTPITHAVGTRSHTSFLALHPCVHPTQHTFIIVLAHFVTTQLSRNMVLGSVDLNRQ